MDREGTRILKSVERLRDAMVQWLREFIGIPTVNGEETVLAERIVELCREWGVRAQVWEKEPRRGNAVLELGEGQPSLLLTAHLDTVPPGAGWKTDPFRAEVRDGWVVGRGAVDDKGPLVSILGAVRAILDLDVELQGRVIVVGAAGEETGRFFGLPWLLEEGVVQPTYAIVAEATDNVCVEVAEKGILYVRVVTRGRAAHGSKPELGVNAIVHMAQVIQRLATFHIPHPPHPYLSPPTINIGTICGGTAANVVPDRCELVINIRYLPGQREEEILDIIRAEAEAAGRSLPGFRVEVERIRGAPPAETNPESAVVRAVRYAIRRVWGAEARLVGTGITTHAKPLRLRGIETAVYGPGREAMCHVANERIEIEELVRGAAVYALATTRLLGSQ